MDEEITTSRLRLLSGNARWLERCLLIGIMCVGVVYLLEVHIYLRIIVLPLQYQGLFLAMVLSAIFILAPASSRAPRNYIPWYDIILAILGFLIGVYIVIYGPEFLNIPNVVVPERWIPGVIAIPLCIEAVRRTLGKALAIIALFMVLFAHFGYYLPWVFFGRKMYSWPYIMQYLYQNPNGLFGIVMAVVSEMVLGFILFGSFLTSGQGGSAITNFAVASFGRFRGGPAKVSVLTSGLFGMVSGSVSSNVVIDGVFTIPMMMKTGFKPATAAAIEAVTSTGGAIMPPVMGAAAFIIAETLGVPYGKVAVSAAIPAIMYYICIFFQIQLEANRLGLKGLKKSELPPFWPSLWGTWIIAIPLVILVYVLMVLWWAPGKAALVAAATVLVITSLQRKTRLTLSGFIEAIENAGKTMLSIGAIAAGAGIIVGGLHLCGSAFAFTMVCTQLGQDYLFLVLVITAIVALILGMGMPTTAIYVVVSVLVAPSVVSMGINQMAAHLFVFYYAVMAFISPPVASAVYLAAPLAGASVMRTGWEAVRLGAIGFIVPFIFVYNPVLILEGPLTMLVPTLITAVMGIWLIAIGANGFWFKEVRALRRILLLIAGILLIIPLEITPIALTINICGFAAGVFLLWPEWKILMAIWKREKEPINLKNIRSS